jgi:hypothetical protein
MTRQRPDPFGEGLELVTDDRGREVVAPRRVGRLGRHLDGPSRRPWDWCRSAPAQPGIEGGQRASGGVVAGGDGDDLAAAFLGVEDAVDRFVAMTRATQRRVIITSA